jgi:hypothetical protein
MELIKGQQYYGTVVGIYENYDRFDRGGKTKFCHRIHIQMEENIIDCQICLDVASFNQVSEYEKVSFKIHTFTKGQYTLDTIQSAERSSKGYPNENININPPPNEDKSQLSGQSIHTTNSNAQVALMASVKVFSNKSAIPFSGESSEIDPVAVVEVAESFYTWLSSKK